MSQPLLPSDSSERKGLGTFVGVFTPSILTILGIILFLRLGFVVGESGLGQAIAIILLANSISVLTSFSLAAIATNFEVRGGGDYYLISRTLGPEFGGAIGIVLFLAQSVSVAFYALGFSEGLTALFDAPWLDPRFVAGAALLPLFVLAWMGSDWASRFQFAIMAVLTLAIAAFVVGAVGAFDAARLSEGWSSSGQLPFWTLFALFFPAVTGFTQGVSMSGELRDPARSLPLGTFLAVGVSLVVYLAVAVLFAGALPGSALSSDYAAMSRVAVAPWIITAGIFAATLSSALASFLGAPRILQALATDKLFRVLTPFAAGFGETGNPRRATLLSFAIALGTVAVGDLNLVAPVVSMFFLISYGLLNYATYYEASSKSPSFRPRFRWYDARLSLVGCVACGGVMLAIDPTSGAIAIFVLVAIHQFLARSTGIDRWADGSRSALFQRVRRSLFEMRDIPEHGRDWRPVILAFSDDPERRERIVRFASWIEGGSGFTTAVKVIEGEGPRVRAERVQAEAELAADIRSRGLEAFACVVATPDLTKGFQVLLQASGLGPIRPNIALVNWFDHEDRAEDAPAMRYYGEILRNVVRFGCNVVVLAARGDELSRLATDAARPRQIDIWWRDDASSRLALLLGYLVTRGEPWSQARLRVLAPLPANDAEGGGEGRSGEAVLENLRETLDEVRIRADTALVSDTGWETIRTESEGTDLAFLPIRIRDEGLCDASGVPLPGSLEGLPPLALVQAAGDILLDAQPDEGAQADVAKVVDASEGSRKHAEELRAELAGLQAEANELDRRLAEARAANTPPDELAALEKSASQARAAAGEVERRAVKAEVKAQQLADEVRTLAPELTPEESPKAEL